MLQLAADGTGAGRQRALAEAHLAADELAHAATLDASCGPSSELQRRSLGYVVSRAACRLLLAAELGVAPSEVTLARDARGAPKVLPPHAGASVSLAHSSQHVACAVSVAAGVGIGVDVEGADRFATAQGQPLRLARRFLHRQIAAALAPLDATAQAQAFLRAWTVVEAVGKAHGVGLALPLRHATVTPARLTGPACVGLQPAPQWLPVDVAAGGDTRVVALAWPALHARGGPVVTLACCSQAWGRPKLRAHAELPFA